jgi:predicted O-linked N-acetylglucosamine transferase (SPINDLY family)
VIAANPRDVSALQSLGIFLRDEGRTEEALHVLRTAVGAQPDKGEALLVLANMMIPFREHCAEALGYAQRAVQLLPGEARAHGVLGRLLERNARLKEAALSLETALRIEPKDTGTLLAYADVLLGLGRHSEAVELLRKVVEYDPDDACARTNLLFTLSHVSDDAELLLREHREWAARHIVPVAPRVYPNSPDPDRVLRVGYVSADLKRAHPVTYFFEPILANHDPARVHTVCYSGVVTQDACTARIKALAHVWRDIEGMRNEDFVALVQRDQIDILVDLSGHTGGYRLKAFGQRPAPVQITYLGYSFTTGMAEMDYRITDAIADPDGADRYYTERLIRLPGGFCCYSPPRDAPEVWASPPAAARGYVTFGSLNKPQRLTDDVIALWSRVLRAVPRSRLFIGRAEIQGEVADMLARRFARHGIQRERIEMGYSAVGSQTHLSLYARFDIALDTFPWSGHTTSCEALWMGVPVITLYGKTHAGRMVASVLNQIGLESLVARTPDEYVRIAKNLARDVGTLAGMRMTMRDRMRSSPLCDGKAFTVSLEQAYRDVWVRWCATQRGT